MDDTPKGELILYHTANDVARVKVLYESDTFWLDQRAPRGAPWGAEGQPPLSEC